MSLAAPAGGVRPRLAVYLIAAAAFFVRLLHVLSYDSTPTNDMDVYVDMAVERLALGNLFSMDGYCWFPPGYAIFMRPFFLLLEKEAALTAVRIAQAALGAWTCLLLYRIGRRSLSRLAGLCAAAMAAFYPHFVFYTSAWMSETLFIALYYAADLRFLRAIERPRAGWLYGAGVLTAAATLVRPVAISLAPVALAAAWRSGATRERRIRSLGLVLAGAVTLIGPWALRNWIAYGHLVVIAPNGPFNLATGNQPGATGRYATPPSIAGDHWARMDDFRSRALEFLFEDPWGALFVVMRLKWLAIWEMIPPWPLYSSNPLLYHGEIFFPYVPWRVVGPLGFAGLGVLLARRARGWWRTPACCAAYVAVYLVFFGGSRFRMPAEGFFLVWAGILVASVLRASRRLRRMPTRAWAAVSTLVLAVVLAHSGLQAASARRALASPGTLVASGGQFPVIPSKESIPLFEGGPIPVDRTRERYLRLSMQAYRMGPHRSVPGNGLVRILFRDHRGAALNWLENPTFFLEALPADRWVPITLRAHIPPAARSLEALLLPDPASPDVLIIDQPILRYLPGNDLALESLFPYLRYRE